MIVLFREREREMIHNIEVVDAINKQFTGGGIRKKGEESRFSFIGLTKSHLMKEPTSM